MKEILNTLDDIDKKLYYKYIWALNKKTSLKSVMPAMDSHSINTEINFAFAYNYSSLIERLLKYQSKKLSVDEIELFYLEYIKRINALIKDFYIEDDPVKIFSFLYPLYKNGNISTKRKFEDSSENLIDIYYKSLLGANIVTGKGVCRHTSRLFQDILIENGINSQIILIDVPKIESVGIESNKILSRSLSILEILKLISGNEKAAVKFDVNSKSLLHAIVGIEYNGEYYLMDINNNILFCPHKISQYYDKVLPFESSIKQIPESLLGAYEASDDTIITSENCDIGLIRCVIDKELQSDASAKEKYIKLQETKEKLSRIKPIDESIQDKRKQTESLYYSNLDVIDEFYRSNKDFYDEFANKLFQLKK